MIDLLIFFWWKHFPSVNISVFAMCARDANDLAVKDAKLPALFVLHTAWQALTPREKRFLACVGGWPIEPMDRIYETIQENLRELKKKQS